MHRPTIGSTRLKSVFTHCQNWRRACAKRTAVDYLLSPVYQKAPRGRRGAFFCWNAYRREFPRVRDIGQSAAWQWGSIKRFIAKKLVILSEPGILAVL